MKIVLGLLTNPIGCPGIFLAIFLGLKTSAVIAGELREFPSDQPPAYEMQQQRQQQRTYEMQQQQIQQFPPRSRYYGEYERMRTDIEGLSDPARQRFMDGLINQLRDADRAGDRARVEYYMGLINFVNEVR
jgi:hypothetical protein